VQEFGSLPDVAEFTNRRKGQDIQEVLPITVRHNPVLLWDDGDWFDEEVKVGDGSARVIIVKPTKSPVKQLLVAFPVRDASKIPDEAESEVTVLLPRAIQIHPNLCTESVRSKAIEGVQNGREGGTIRRCEVSGESLVEGRLERVHHGVLRGWGHFVNLHYILGASNWGRKENVKEIWVVKLGDFWEKNRARGGSRIIGGGGGHSSTQTPSGTSKS
jgi:hypothetical protein